MVLNGSIVPKLDYQVKTKYFLALSPFLKGIFGVNHKKVKKYLVFFGVSNFTLCGENAKSDAKYPKF